MASNDSLTFKPLLVDAKLEKIYIQTALAYVLIVLCLVWLLSEFFWISIMGLILLAGIILRECMFLKENIKFMKNIQTTSREVIINIKGGCVDLKGKEIPFINIKQVRLKALPYPKLKGISKYYIIWNFVNALMEFDINAPNIPNVTVQNKKVIRDMIDILVEKNCQVLYDMKEIRL